MDSLVLELFALHAYKWRFPKIGVALKSSGLNGVVSIIKHPVWGTTIYESFQMNTNILYRPTEHPIICMVSKIGHVTLPYG